MKNENIDRLENSLKYLNLKARDFYTHENEILDIDNTNRIKATLLTGIIDFERVIRGTFGCDLTLKDVDIEKLKRMFPNACNNIFKLTDDAIKMGEFFENFRNINAHAFISKEDELIFNCDFSSLRDAPKYDKRIEYLVDNEITLAGLFFVLLNVLREESIKTISIKEHGFGVVAEGKYTVSDGVKFVEEVSHVDLEITIRDKEDYGLLDSILGFYKNKSTKVDEFNYTVLIGNKTSPTTNIKFKLYYNQITVYEGSVTKTYYKQNYFLNIDQQDLFMELCNRLPPFVLVDYLYLKGIDNFTTEVYEQLVNDKLLYKLNKPKFYVDKNIGVLLLTEEVSDYRLISSVVSDGLIALFISFEEYLYSKYGLLEEDMYSSLRTALVNKDMSYKVKTRILALRNLVAHGYMFGDHTFIYGDKYVEYDLRFVNNSLYMLLKELKETNKEDYEFIAARISGLYIRRTIEAKFKKMDDVSFKYIMNDGKGDINELRKKYSLIEHSSFNTNMLYNVSRLCHSHFRIIEVQLPDLDFPLLMLANKTSIEKVEQFSEKLSYRYNKPLDGLFIVYEFIKS